MILKNKLKQNVCLGAFLPFPSAEIVEILGYLKWDVVVIDLEHGGMTRSDLGHLIRAAESAGISTMVRVPENNPKLILGALDLGAEGIVVPMINSVEDAQLAISSLHYPPKGIRGFSQGRAGKYGIGVQTDEHVQNTENLVIALQVETKKAIDNVNEIAKVPGADIIFIGPSDLSASYNLIGKVKNQKFQKLIEETSKTIVSNKKIAGTFSNDLKLNKKYLSYGYTFLLTNVVPSIVAGFNQFKRSLNKH